MALAYLVLLTQVRVGRGRKVRQSGCAGAWV